MLAVMLLNACTDNVISIESEDSVTFTTLETSFPVNRQETLKIKLRGSRTSGEYSQTVPDGKMILIEDVQIRGPTGVDGSTDHTYASVSIGTDDMFNTPGMESKFRGLMYVGVAQTNMDLTLIHEGTTYTTNDRTTELYMQVGMDYEIVPSLYGGGTWAFSIGPDLTGISEIDLKLNYAVFKHLEVMGGYRWLKYKEALINSSMNYQSTKKGKCDFPFFIIFNDLLVIENGSTSLCCGNSELIRASITIMQKRMNLSSM